MSKAPTECVKENVGSTQNSAFSWLHKQQAPWVWDFGLSFQALLSLPSHLPNRHVCFSYLSTVPM